MSSMLQNPSVKRTRTLGFEDLPAEIRNEIYMLSLVLPGVTPIHTIGHVRLHITRKLLHDRRRESRIQGKYQERFECWKRFGRIHDQVKHEGTITAITTLDSQALPAQLLAVCRLTRAEATPILYGLNRLRLPREICVEFVRKVGPSIQYIRQLTVDIGRNTDKQSMRELEWTLLPAARLQSLVIANGVPGNPCFTPKAPRTMSRNMAQLLKSWACRLLEARTQSSDIEGPSTSQVAKTFHFAGFKNADAYTSEVSKSLQDLLDKAKVRQSQDRKN